MVSVRQHHLRPGGGELGGGDGFDVGQGAHGHKPGRVYGAVGGGEGARPRLGVATAGVAAKGKSLGQNGAFRGVRKRILSYHSAFLILSIPWCCSHVYLGFVSYAKVWAGRGKTMSVLISDEILQASQLTPAEFRKEIALHLFQSGRLTLGCASQLAELPLNDFRQFLKQRNIPLYVYDVEDFELDLKNLQALGRL